jgi:hypothetical protein
MKRWLAVILCLACLPVAAAFAQQPGDPATKEDVQKLFDIQNSRKLFDSIMTAMKQQIPVMTKSAMSKQLSNATAEQTAQLNAFMDDSVEKMFQNMPFDELMAAAMPAYQHHFTHGEMQELIQFYSSPLGKKLLAEMPAIMTEYMQAATPVIQRWMKSQMADLQVSAERYAKTLKYAKNQNQEKTPANPLPQTPQSIPASLAEPLN